MYKEPECWFSTTVFAVAFRNDPPHHKTRWSNCFEWELQHHLQVSHILFPAPYVFWNRETERGWDKEVRSSTARFQKWRAAVSKAVQLKTQKRGNAQSLLNMWDSITTQLECHTAGEACRILTGNIGLQSSLLLLPKKQNHFPWGKWCDAAPCSGPPCYCIPKHRAAQQGRERKGCGWGEQGYLPLLPPPKITAVALEEKVESRQSWDNHFPAKMHRSTTLSSPPSKLAGQGGSWELILLLLQFREKSRIWQLMGVEYEHHFGFCFSLGKTLLLH